MQKKKKETLALILTLSVPVPGFDLKMEWYLNKNLVAYLRRVACGV